MLIVKPNALNTLFTAWGMNLNNTEKIVMTAKRDKEMRRKRTGIEMKESDIILTRETANEFLETLSVEVKEERSLKDCPNVKILEDLNMSSKTLASVTGELKDLPTIASTNRLDVLLKLRKYFGIKTPIVLSNVGKILNLNDPDSIEIIRSLIVKYVRGTTTSNKSLEAIAGLTAGVAASIARNPEKYLSTMTAIHCYSVWIAPIYFDKEAKNFSPADVLVVQPKVPKGAIIGYRDKIETILPILDDVIIQHLKKNKITRQEMADQTKYGYQTLAPYYNEKVKANRDARRPTNQRWPTTVSLRFSACIRICRTFNIPVKFKCLKTGKVWNLINKEEIDDLRSIVITEIKTNIATTVNAKAAQAGVTASMLSCATRNPDELSEVLTLHYYSNWVATLYYTPRNT